MNLVIKKANEQELMKAYALISACGEEMYKRYGLCHWYPFASLEQFKERVQYADVYCIYHNERLVGTFNLSMRPRAYYAADQWSNSLAKAVYVGNVAIDPLLQGQKLGTWSMQQIENIAREMGGIAIRLDCVDRHPWLQSFYTKLGYAPAGTIDLPEPTGRVRCFEKVI
jgi:GNAT superfamily N-acetyltransferase